MQGQIRNHSQVEGEKLGSSHSKIAVRSHNRNLGHIMQHGKQQTQRSSSETQKARKSYHVKFVGQLGDESSINKNGSINKSVHPSSGALIPTETELFQSKIRKETSKIIEMQISREEECKEIKNKISQLKEIVERQKINILEQQKNCEIVTHEYVNEIKQQRSLEEKIQDTRFVCSILQENFQKLNILFQSFVATRKYLLLQNNNMVKEYDHLAEMFNMLEVKNSRILQNVNKTFLDERDKHVCESNEWNAMHVSLEKKLNELGQDLKQMQDERIDLERKMSYSCATIQYLSESRETIIKELNMKTSNLEKSLSQTISETNILKEEASELKTLTDGYKKLSDMLKNVTEDCESISENICAYKKKFDEMKHLRNEEKLKLEKYKSENNDLVLVLQQQETTLHDTKISVDKEIAEKLKVKSELQQCTNILNEKRNHFEYLKGNKSMEVSTLKETIQNKEIQLAEEKQQSDLNNTKTYDLQCELQQYENKSAELEKEVQALRASEIHYNENLHSFKNMYDSIKEEKNSLIQDILSVTDTLNTVRTLNTDLKAEKARVKNSLNNIEKEFSIKENELLKRVQSKENECGAKIKEMLFCLEEYKRSFVNRLSTYEEDLKKLNYRIDILKGDHAELLEEKESSEVKIIKQEEVIKKSESKFQTLEKEIFKLKTILEAEKNKNIDVPVPLQNTQVNKKKKCKRVKFDGWSDTTDDSDCLNLKRKIPIAATAPMPKRLNPDKKKFKTEHMYRENNQDVSDIFSKFLDK